MIVPTAEVIARKLGDTDPDEDALAEYQDALDAAIADVEAYLGRPILPRTYTDEHLWPHPEGWALTHDPVLSIVSATAESFDGYLTGMFTVVYTAGLDYATDPDMNPVRRYVLAAALNDPLLAESRRLARAQAGEAAGPVKSITASTEGQSRSITYDTGKGLGGGGAAASDSPGALPSKSSMDRWRRANRRVYQPPAVDYPRW